MNPPLRTEADRLALLEGLRDGTLDCVATDHAPHARHEKEVPFEEAPFGVTGLETSFAASTPSSCSPGRCRSRSCSSGCRPARPARLRPARATHPGGRPGQPRPARSRGGVGGAGGRLPLAVGQLVAAGTHAAGARSFAPSRTGAWCTRPCRPEASHDGGAGIPRTRGRHRPARPIGRRRRRHLRRGRLHHRHERLPGDRHRSELCGPARVLHDADGRQLRRRRGTHGVGRTAREGAC